MLWFDLWPRWVTDSGVEAGRRGNRYVTRRRCLDMAQVKGLLWSLGYKPKRRRAITEDLLEMEDETLRVLNEK